mgnify:CR=1 FL=1
MKKLKYKLNPRQKIASEMLAVEPHLNNRQLAEKTGISINTIAHWRRTPVFLEACYERFMEVSGKYLPEILMAVIREALEGNIKASELLLKHYGKLQDTLTINHKISSPFQSYLDSMGNDNIEEAEIVTDELSDEMAKLPPRNLDNDRPMAKVQADNKGLKRATMKAKKAIEANRSASERYHLRKRAKAVGLEPLGAGRPTPAKMREWLAELERRESDL